MLLEQMTSFIFQAIIMPEYCLIIAIAKKTKSDLMYIRSKKSFLNKCESIKFDIS